MPTESGKPLIVISYAPEDEPERPTEGEVKWLSFVTGYLMPAIKQGAAELWLDQLMPGGDWQVVIEQKLRACDIFILLVSRHSLSSYVVDNQIKIIRERQRRGEAVHFYPLVLTPTHKGRLNVVVDQNLRPPDGKPLSDYPVHERHQHMNEAANEIAKIADKIATRRRPSFPPTIEDLRSISDWLQGQNREVAVAIAARAALRVAPLAESANRRSTQRMMSAVFRATALARAAVKYPGRANEFSPPALAAHAARAAGDAVAVYAAADAVDAVHEAGYVDHAARAAAKAAEAGLAARALWQAVQADAAAVLTVGARGMSDLPLWPDGMPTWVHSRWANLAKDLPKYENWDVWIDWYENRLHGGSPGEGYELVFASVPQEQWDKSPAAANAWIKRHLPTEELQPISGAFSLEAWLTTQTRETATAIAFRAAARVAPLSARITRKGPDPRRTRELTHLAGVIFRALGSARASVQDSDRIFISSARNAAGAASASSVVAIVSGDVARAAMFATAAAANSAAAAATAIPHVSGPAAAAVRASVDAFVSADPSASDADTAAWNEILADVEATQRGSVGAVLEAPLWRQGEPKWAPLAVEILQAALPEDEDWDVWSDWYEQRLHGGSRDEDYELVFASVPQEEWEKGPAAANAWIKAHLPPSKGDALEELPEGDGLGQQAALYTFRLAQGRIAVSPEDARPEDREATRDFLDESRRKAAELRERLVRVQADTRLQRTLTLLDERLAPPIKEIRVGLVLSSLRSLESDVRAYDTEEGRKEHAVDLIAALDDLAGTVRNLVSQFPRSREILTNQVALQLVEEPRALDAAIQASESLAVTAEAHPELINRDAPEALREPKESNEGARTTADRAKQVALRLLTVANFGRIVAQAREIAVESLDEVRKQVPKATGKAAASAVLAGPALALGLWAGHSGLTLLLDAAGAIAAINGAVGHPGGAFDRLLKTIEKVAAKKPSAEARDPPEAKRKPAKRNARRKATARRSPAKPKPNRLGND